MPRPPSRARLRIGIDTGGTFTDMVALDAASGAIRVTKVASTQANPAIGLRRGIDAILNAGGAAPDAVAGLAHVTTVATNALLPGRNPLARPDRHLRLPPSCPRV
jgi:N-methylhydantoinase A